MDKVEALLDRAKYALEFALEMQEGVEEAKPDGYGTPQNTIAWSQNALAVLEDIIAYQTKIAK